MARRFLTSIDLVKNELRNVILHLLGVTPSSPAEGQVYHNTTDHHPHWIGQGGADNDFTNALTLEGESLAGVRDFSQTTGQRDHDAISDFDARVRTSRLDQMAAPTAAVSANSQRLTNLADASADTDAPSYAQVRALINGMDNKASVRAASTANVNVAAPGAVIDGANLNAGERVLLAYQTAPAENGIWIWNGAAAAMTRATDADISAEVTAGLYVFVSEGTQNANRGFQLFTDDPITLGTTALDFQIVSGAGQITATAPLSKSGDTISLNLNARLVDNGGNLDLEVGVIAPGTYESITVDAYGRATAGTNPYRVKKYSALVGNDAATSFNITQATHGCAADRTNVVFVLEESSGDEVIADVSIAANGTVTISFAVAPTNNQYRVTILG